MQRFNIAFHSLFCADMDRVGLGSGSGFGFGAKFALWHPKRVGLEDEG
jgi:hypothetical protein